MHIIVAIMRPAYNIILLCVFTYLNGCVGVEMVGSSVIRIEKFMQCPDKQNLPNVFKNIVISQVGFNKIRVYGDIIIRQEIAEPTSLKVILHKCASKEEPDTCEYYYTYKADNFCSMVADKNKPWSGFWLQTTLPSSCPIKPGNYSMKGTHMDAKTLPTIPILFGYWKVRSSGKSKGKTWHCVISEFSVSADSRKRRKGGKNK